MGKIPQSDELIRQIMCTIEVSWKNHIEEKDIQKWLDNFDGAALQNEDYEKNLALWLLYNFTYINEDEVKYLCKLLFRKYVHSYINESEDKVEQTDIDTLLKKTSFFSLGKIGESSGFVMYLFRQQNELPISFFEDNENFSDDKICVFVDDMTLSGDQALRNISKIKYGDWRVKDDEIAGFEKVFRKKGDNFIKAVKSHINAKLEGRYFQKEINRLLRSETFFDDYCEQISFESIDENLQFLLDKYRDDRESMSEYAIRKMNRLIFENLYPADISKSRGVIRNDQIVLLTFFASATAKKTLADEHINVIYCIELDNSSRAFAADSMTFANFPQEKDDCLKMCNYYGKKINFKNPLGYNDCQYLIGLYYNTPNNSLPIFWGSKHWNPIFIRHEKKYGGQAYVGGQFI